MKGQNYLDSIDEGEMLYFLNEVGLDSTGTIDIHGLYFDLGKSTLVNDEDPRILAIACFMMKHPTYIVEIGTHSDCRGSDLSCKSLSQKRAETVAKHLTNLGISNERIIAKGFGETQPGVYEGNHLTCNYIQTFSLHEQEELHQKNRRLTLRILAR